MAALDLASPPRTPTIYDIAAMAGVSHTTVSRALNGEDGMTAQTRARIVELAARLGYRPNTSARVLAGRVRPQIAVAVVDGDHSRQAAGLVAAVARASRSSGHVATVVGVDSLSAESAAAAGARIGEPGICGVVVVADRAESPAVAALAAATPCAVLVVAADDGMPPPGDHSVSTLSLAMAHLQRLGHRDIVQALGDATSADAGFALASGSGLVPSATAIVAPTISFAIGAVSGLRARGLRVPEDVSVIALEDHADAAHVVPALTAVAADADERARRAVAAVIRAGAGSAPVQDAGARPRVVARRSTGPVRAAPTARR